jgi:predicted nucleic acid-binding protein
MAVQDRPVYYIDTSVILSLVFDDPRYESQEYLNIVGYKAKNKGVLSQFTIGELFSNVLLKLKEDIVRKNAYDLLDWIIRKLLDEDRANILKFDGAIVNSSLFEEIRTADYAVTDDDAFHLMCAIACKAACFVTKDIALCSNQRLKEYLMKKFNLKLRLIVS